MLNRTKKMKICSLSANEYFFLRVNGDDKVKRPLSLEELKRQMEDKLKQFGLKVEEVQPKKANVIMRLYRCVYYQYGATNTYNTITTEIYVKEHGYFENFFGKRLEIFSKDGVKQTVNVKNDVYEARSESCDYYLRVR